MDQNRNNNGERIHRMITSLIRKIINEVRINITQQESDESPSQFERKDKNKEREIRRPFQKKKNKRFI